VLHLKSNHLRVEDPFYVRHTESSVDRPILSFTAASLHVLQLREASLNCL